MSDDWYLVIMYACGIALLILVSRLIRGDGDE